VEVQSGVHPVGELCAALHKKKIRFLIVGGAAAVLHGAPVSTFDADIWVDLPERQYVRILAIGQQIGANILSRNVLGLRNDQRVDFLYRIDGLASFATEWRRAEKMIFGGQSVKVLSLERIIRSKEAANRDKDILALPTLRTYLACRQTLRRKGKQT
jgi:predicted nucleotidyltransferase